MSSNEESGQGREHTAQRDLSRHDEVKDGGLTYDDYAALDDDVRYELANGVLELMSPAPTPAHQLVALSMVNVLQASCSSDYLVFMSPMDVILSQQEVRQPDIALVHCDRSHLVTRRGIEGPPDLVVEILSQHSVKRDRQQKLRIYAEYGIPEYWIVTIEHATLEQYVLADGKYDAPLIYTNGDIIRSRATPCVSFSMEDVMRQLPDLSNMM